MNRTLIYLSIAATLAALALAGYILWFLVVGKMGAESSTLETAIEAKKLEATRITEAKDTLALLSASEARVGSYFIATSDVVSFLEAIGNTGDPVGAVVTVVGVTEDKNALPHGRMTLSLRIEGSFDSVVRTLGMLEHGPYDAVLSSAALDSNGDASKWTASAILSIGTKPTTP